MHHTGNAGGQFRGILAHICHGFPGPGKGIKMQIPIPQMAKAIDPHIAHAGDVQSAAVAGRVQSGRPGDIVIQVDVGQRDTETGSGVVFDPAARTVGGARVGLRELVATNKIVGER